MTDDTERRLREWAATGGGSARPRRGSTARNEREDRQQTPENVPRNQREEDLRMFEEAGPLSDDELAPRPSRPTRADAALRRTGPLGERPSSDRRRAPVSTPRSPTPRPKRPATEPKMPSTSSKSAPADATAVRKNRKLSAPPPERTPSEVRATARRRQRNWDGPLVGVTRASDPPPAAWTHLLAEFDPTTMSENDVFHVGLDVGTSGIRIGCTNSFTGQVSFFDFGANLAGGTRFSFPALVGIEGTTMVFGNDAVPTPWRNRFASFKAGLLFPERERQDTAQWARLDLVPHTDAFSGSDGPGIACFLFAAAVGRVLTEALPTLIGDLENRFLTFSVGAPLDGDSRRPLFRRTFATGVLLAGRVPPRIEASHLVELFARAWDDSVSLASAPEGLRRVYVRHEAQLVTRPLEALMQPMRTFLVVDVGATTTEVAILRQGDDGIIHRWASESLPVGIDSADLDKLRASGQHDLVALRVNRKTGKRVRQPWIEELADDVWREVRRVSQDAIALNPDRKSWSVLNVALAGGGSNLSEIRKAVLKGDRPHKFVESLVHHPLRLEKDVTVVGASTSHIDASEVPELLCLAGAVTSPDEDQPYSEATLDEVLPTYEDPIAELKRDRRGRWLG